MRKRLLAAVLSIVLIASSVNIPVAAVHAEERSAAVTMGTSADSAAQAGVLSIGNDAASEAAGAGIAADTNAASEAANAGDADEALAPTAGNASDTDAASGAADTNASDETADASGAGDADGVSGTGDAADTDAADAAASVTEEASEEGTTLAPEEAGTAITEAKELLRTEAEAEEDADYVASIGDVEYSSLQDAVNAATDGDTIKLLDCIDYNAGDALTVDRSMTLTIDLNGYSITGDQSITVKVCSGSLTLTGDGSIGNYNTSEESACVVKVTNDAELLVDSGVTISSESTAGIDVSQGTAQQVTVKGILLVENASAITCSCFGSGANTVTIDGANITTKGISVRQGSTLNIKECTCTSSNGGICIYSGGTLNITGGTFKLANEIALMEDSTANITGGTYNFNPSAYLPDGYKPQDNGDGTYTVVEGTVTMQTVTFDLQGHGDAIDPETVAEGKTIMQPASPVAAGYTFLGWYMTSDCSGNQYDFSAPVTTSFTLYAKWDAGEHAAAIGNVYYASLQDAVNAAKDGDTITLLETVFLETGKSINVDRSIDLTIDFNLHGITGDSDILMKVCSGSLTLTGTDGYISSTSTMGDGKCVIKVKNDAELLVDSSVTLRAEAVAGIDVSEGTAQKVTVKGQMWFLNSSAITCSCYGGGANTVTIADGAYISTKGMSVRKGSTLIIEGGYCNVPDGNVYVYGGGTLLITGGEIGTPEPVVSDGGTVSISGGTCAFDPNNYLADGYKAKLNANSWYEVKPASEVSDYEAEIGSKKYATLGDAINASKNGSTITLLSDVLCYDEDYHFANKSVTVDLNGFTISGNGVLFAVGATTPGGKGNVAGGLTITGKGRIESYADCEVIHAQGSSVLYIGPSVVVCNPNGICIDVSNGDGQTVIVAGTIEAINGDAFGFFKYDGAPDQDGALGSITVLDGASIIAKGMSIAGSLHLVGGTYDIEDGITLCGSGTATLTGGTYSFDPTPYLTDGYTAKKGTDGMWTLSQSATEPVTFSVRADEESEWSPVTSKAEVAAGTQLLLESATDGAQIYYTTDGTAPSESSSVYRSPITINTDCTVRAYAVKTGWAKSKTTSYSFSVKEDEYGDVSKEDVDNIYDGDTSKIPNGLWTAGISESVTYTGAAITFPEIRVYYYKKLLTASDYSIAYKNNTAAYDTAKLGCGTKAPQVVVTGKGSYTGTKSTYFTIAPRKLSEDHVYAPDVTLSCTGKDQKPAPTVYWDGALLKAKTDYTYTYKQGTQKLDAVKAAGKYTIVVTGQGNYSGSYSVNLEVIDPDASKTPLDKVTVKIPAQAYLEGGYSAEKVTEIFKTSNIAVKNGKDALTLGTDYEISEVLNSETPGSATVVLKAKGSKYKGTKAVPMTINGIALSKCTLYYGSESSKSCSEVYTGNAITPAVTLTYKASSKASEITLRAGVDYEETLVYAGNVAVGKKATVTVTGKGQYTGTLTKTFTITAYKVEDKNDKRITVTLAKSYPYVKGGVKPLPVVTDKNTGNTLTLGTDYTLSYANNTGAANKTPTVTITFKGNYTGKITKEFKIGKQELGNMTLSLVDKTVGTGKNAWKTKVTVLDTDGKALAGTGKTADYNAAGIKYTYLNTTVVTRVGGGSQTVTRVAGEAVNESDIVPAGTTIRVEVTAADGGKYTGSISGNYRIIAKGMDISKAKVSVNSYYYTGSAICPTKKEITVTFGSGKSAVKLKDSEYEIVGYSNNTAVGSSATITIRGVGKYGGTKTQKFTINKRNVK